MAYCPKCGNNIIDEKKGCTNCGYGNDQGYSKGNYNEGYNNGGVDTSLSNGMKVFIVAMTLLIPGVGYIVGLVLAIIFMGKDDKDHKTFGKALLTLVIIMIVLSILCCILYFIFGIAMMESIDGGLYLNDMITLPKKGFI